LAGAEPRPADAVDPLGPDGPFSRATYGANRLDRSDRARVDAGFAVASRALRLRGRSRDPGVACGGGGRRPLVARERFRRSAHPLPRAARSEVPPGGDAERSPAPDN